MDDGNKKAKNIQPNTSDIRLRQWCITKVMNTPALSTKSAKTIIENAQELYKWVTQQELQHTPSINPRLLEKCE